MDIKDSKHIVSPWNDILTIIANVLIIHSQPLRKETTLIFLLSSISIFFDSEDYQGDDMGGGDFDSGK